MYTRRIKTFSLTGELTYINNFYHYKTYISQNPDFDNDILILKPKRKIRILDRIIL